MLGRAMTDEATDRARESAWRRAFLPSPAVTGRSASTTSAIVVSPGRPGRVVSHFGPAHFSEGQAGETGAALACDREKAWVPPVESGQRGTHASLRHAAGMSRRRQ
jgi:hypothetical protein